MTKESPCQAAESLKGLENKIIRPEFAEFPAEGSVRRRQRLGGLLNYYRKAA